MTEGLLQEIKLAEIIQLIGMSEMTGDLELTPLFPAGQRQARLPVGHLFFYEGNPHAAFLADRTGEAAAENLFLWEAGFFVFRPLATTELPPANLRQGIESLILRGLDRLEAWNAALTLVPTLRAILCLAPADAARPAPEARAAALLAACDGQRQLAEIAVTLGWGGLRCREAAASLLRAGHVAYRPFSDGEKLVQAVVAAALPSLGVAADLFCDDALAAVGLIPEHLGRLTNVSVLTVQQMIGAIERDVAATLDAERAAALGDHLRVALRVPGRGVVGGAIEHV